MRYSPVLTPKDLFLKNEGFAIDFAEIGENQPLLYKNRDIEIDKFSKYIRPYDLVVDPYNADSKIDVSANGTADGSMSNDNSGIIDIRGLTASSTNLNYKIKILDNSSNQQLSNQAIHAQAIIGTGKKPFPVFPFIINEGQSYSVSVEDLSGASNEIRPCFKGYKYFCDVKKYLSPAYLEALSKSYFFIYTTREDIKLSADQKGFRSSIKINSNHDFIAKHISFYSTGNFLIRISSNNSIMSNGWMHSSCISGSAKDSYRYTQNVKFERTEVIEVEINNLESSDNEIYLAISGIAFEKEE